MFKNGLTNSHTNRQTDSHTC